MSDTVVVFAARTTPSFIAHSHVLTTPYALITGKLKDVNRQLPYIICRLVCMVFKIFLYFYSSFHSQSSDKLFSCECSLFMLP